MSSTAKKRHKGKASRSGTSYTRACLPLLDEPPPGLFPSRVEFLKVFAVVVIAASVAIACHYVSHVLRRRTKTFCDSGEEPQEFCDVCPDRGECSGGKLECLHGFKKQGRKCIQDTKTNKMVEEHRKHIEDYICHSYAYFLCGGMSKIWFPEADVLKILDKLNKMSGMGDKWNLVNQAIKASESSIEWKTTSEGTQEIKCKETFVEHYKSYLCRVRHWIYKSASLLLPLVILAIGLVWVILRVHRNRYISSRAVLLYEEVCELLEENALTTNIINNDSESCVSFSWLRDHLLLPKERKDTMLWKKVQELIQEDSRIYQYPRLIKGEQKIVLEWQVEGSLSSKIRAKAVARRRRMSNHTRKVEQEAKDVEKVEPKMWSAS